LYFKKRRKFPSRQKKKKNEGERRMMVGEEEIFFNRNRDEYYFVLSALAPLHYFVHIDSCMHALLYQRLTRMKYEKGKKI
jgi:hypothetical protein